MNKLFYQLRSNYKRYNPAHQAIDVLLDNYAKKWIDSSSHILEKTNYYSQAKIDQMMYKEGRQYTHFVYSDFKENRFGYAQLEGACTMHIYILQDIYHFIDYVTSNVQENSAAIVALVTEYGWNFLLSKVISTIEKIAEQLSDDVPEDNQSTDSDDSDFDGIIWHIEGRSDFQGINFGYCTTPELAHKIFDYVLPKLPSKIQEALGIKAEYIDASPCGVIRLFDNKELEWIFMVNIA